MPHFQPINGEEVFLNLGLDDCLDDGSPIVLQDTKEKISLLRNLPHVKPISEKHIEAIEYLWNEAYVCLSAVSLFQPGLHRDVCREFNDNSELAIDLRLALANAGSFHFLDKLTASARSYADGTIERILAVFSACTVGIASLDDAPIEYIHTVVDFFRSADGLGWNDEVIGKNRLIVQCLSNVIAGLATILEDPRLAAKARKHRASGGKRAQSWIEFQHSKDEMDQEILEMYKNISEDSRMRLDVAQSALISISSWLKDAFPTQSLKEIILSPSRTSTFSEFLKKKSGGEINAHTLTVLEAARRISTDMCEQLASVTGGKVFDLVSKKEVKVAKGRFPKKKRPARVRSRPLPEKLIPIFREREKIEGNAALVAAGYLSALSR